MKEDIDILNRILLGQFISGFSLGDTWDMFIGDYCLSAHSIEFKDENLITELLKRNYEHYKFSIDKEDISRSTIMAANLRKRIANIQLDASKNLKIDFENGSELNLITNTEIVDWQWCLNKSGETPYSDYEIACFWVGETKVKK